jgi:hypothetical protein
LANVALKAGLILMSESFFGLRSLAPGLSSPPSSPAPSALLLPAPPAAIAPSALSLAMRCRVASTGSAASRLLLPAAAPAAPLPLVRLTLLLLPPS